MPTAKTDLVIEQGTTWAHGWLVTYNGDPIDDTWSARSQVRHRASDAEVLHTFAASVNPDGSVVIAVEPDESSAWTWISQSAVYDVEVDNGQVPPVVLRVAEGRVTVSPEVTR